MGALVLADLLGQGLAAYGERPALVTAGTTTSYAALDALVERCLRGLRTRGIRAGDRLALLLDNCLEYVIADLAILRLGAVKVPVNVLLAAGDVAHLLEHSGTRLLVVDEARAELAEAALARVRHHVDCVAVGEPAAAMVAWDTLVGELSPDAAAAGRPDPRAPALIMYTGGTTGRPKGVLHTQQALATNLLVHFVCGEILDGERMLLCTPLAHSAGFHLQAGLIQGACVELHSRFEASRWIEAVRDGRAQWSFMVPTMIYRVLETLRERGDGRLVGLRTLVYGAAPITARRLEQALEAFGPVLVQLYGQTEAPNWLTRLSKRDHLDPALAGSCGRPVPGAALRIVAPDGAEVADGQVGEVAARASYTLEAYYDDPSRTAAACSADWLRTGDLGYRTASGHLFLVDRAKDMIISGGMNVYSSEVESVLQQAAGVRHVMVVGVPDDDWGEAVVAFVVPDASLRGTPGRETLLLEHCRIGLARYKVPKRVVFVAELPLTSVGKPDKKRLRSLWPEVPPPP